jgi:hypothetical protein
LRFVPAFAPEVAFGILILPLELAVFVAVGLETVLLPDADSPLEILLMALMPALAEGLRAFGNGPRGAGDGSGGGTGAGISIVIEVVVLMPITNRLLTSSYVDGAISDLESVAADDKAGPKLLGSPFMRFRIICVAAVNCGIYGGRVGDRDDAELL